MSKLQQSLTLRLVAEFCVIVVGVLVALAGDAWLEGRQDREREHQVLRTLASDLEVSIQDLRRDTEDTEQRAKTLNWFVSLGDDRESVVPEDSVFAIGAAANITGAYSPILRAYEAMISAGTLDLIQNPEILLQLADVKKETEEYLDYRDQTTDGWLFTIMPIWLRSVNDVRPGALRSVALRRALDSGEFRAATGQRATFLGFSAAGGFRLLEKMTTAKNLIESELQERFPNRS